MGEMAAAGARRAARRQFETDLRCGLDGGLIIPWFQPVVALRTGEVIGTEALARWTLPDGSLRTTTEFIGQAEDHGLMPLLTDRILFAAAASVAASAADPAFLLHVNISGHELGETAFPRRVIEVLALAGLAPTQVCLEITERALVADTETTRSNLAALRESGVQLAIDDFGVEYSSFGYLRRFPVDILKIDRSFIIDIAQDERDRALVSAMVAMSRALGMRTVAEGVEHVDQAAVLTELGVDEGQGWLFGRPAPLLIAC